MNESKQFETIKQTPDYKKLRRLVSDFKEMEIKKKVN